MIELVSCCSLEDSIWSSYKEWADYLDEEVNEDGLTTD